MKSAMTSSVVIREANLRDGWQSIRLVVPTDSKYEWIDAANAAGVREKEVGSFVPARLSPQPAQIAELVAYGAR